MIVSATLYLDERDDTSVLKVQCRGIRHGAYGELWSLTLPCEGPVTTPAGALELISIVLALYLDGPRSSSST